VGGVWPTTRPRETATRRSITEDVQVLHGFDTTENATAYLSSALFTQDVVGGLSPLLKAEPEIRIYEAA